MRMYLQGGGGKEWLDDFSVNLILFLVLFYLFAVAADALFKGNTVE